LKQSKTRTSCSSRRIECDLLWVSLSSISQEFQSILELSPEQTKSEAATKQEQKAYLQISILKNYAILNLEQAKKIEQQ
jgi:hypothetical protein